MMNRIFPAAILGLVLVSGAQPAQSAFEATPAMRTYAEYEDNPRFLPQNEDDSLGLIVSTLVYLDYRTPDTSINAKPRVRLAEYADSNDEDLDTTDWLFDASAEKMFRRSRIGVATDVSDVAVRTSNRRIGVNDEIDDPAAEGDDSTQVFLDERRVQWGLRPFWEISLTERMRLTMDAAFSKVDFDDNANSGRFDYDNLSVGIGAERALDQWNRVAIRINGSRFESARDPIRSKVESYGLDLTYTRVLSPTMNLTGSIGLAESDVVTTGQTFDPRTGQPCFETVPVFRFVLCRVESSDTDTVARLSLDRQGERTNWGVSLGRSISPNSVGSTVKSDTLNMSVDHRITRKLSGALNMLAYRRENIGSGIQLDDDYFRVITSLRWRFSRSLLLFGEYRFTSRENRTNIATFLDRDADNNTVIFGFGYAPPRKLIR